MQAGLACLLVSVASAASGRWSTVQPMGAYRDNHTATLLPNGKVLVAGGERDGNATPGAELFDPASGTWTNTGTMLVARAFHTATLLPNGKVLVTGGENGNNWYGLSSAELYDPATGLWRATGPMGTNHSDHSATLLQNGKVLVAGNWNNGRPEGNAEIYDPVTETWSFAAPMLSPRAVHTSTLLPDGKVLVVGGNAWSDTYLASTELYDPTANVWTSGPSLSVARQGHTATLLRDGRVLVTGGNSSGTAFASGEFYTPGGTAWSVVTNLLSTARVGHTATLLPNGEVAFAGGNGYGTYLTSTELFDPSSNTCTPGASLSEARWQHSATLLPGGRILVAGGESTLTTRSAEMYDPQSGHSAGGADLNTGRGGQRALLLPDGTVLVAGGGGSNNTFFASAELYDPTAGTWSYTGSLSNSRSTCTMTLLADGRVLVAGGFGGAQQFDGVELYDPATRLWTPGHALLHGRFSHTATLLPNGRVLVCGGTDGWSELASAELYDPASGNWVWTGSMLTNRQSHTATLLANGKVLVVGGYFTSNGYNPIGTAELFDPGNGVWTPAGAPSRVHGGRHSATLLPNGQVLVAGGYNKSNGYLSAADLYDPVSGTWTNTGSLVTPRESHTATLLPDGRVLVAGGTTFSGITDSLEVYDPVSRSWTALGTMTTPRLGQSATLLPNGQVLLAGGGDASGATLASTELFDPSLGFPSGWAPTLLSCSSPVGTGGAVAITGAGFRGVSEGTGGDRQDSGADFPLVQLQSLLNEQMVYLPGTNWWTNSVVAGPVFGFPPGPSLVRVFVNGIPSASQFLSKTRAAALPSLTNLNQTFNDTARVVTGTSVPAGRTVYVTYNGSNLAPTNAGSYTVVGTIDDVDYAGSVTNTLTVDQATASLVLTILTQSYNGRAHTPTAVTTPPGLNVSYTFDGSSVAPTNPGSYVVVGTVNDANAFPVSATNTFVITKATATIELGSLSPTYNGFARVVTAITSPYGLHVDVTYNGVPAAPTNAGSYTVIGTVNDPYYQGSQTNTLTVAKATAGVTLTNLAQVYDGSARAVGVLTSPTNLSVIVKYNAALTPPTNAGSYSITATVTNLNYQGTASGTLVVSKAVAAVTLGNLFQTYDGQPRTVTVSTSPSNLGVALTYNSSSSAPSAVGNYQVVGTINAQNYQGSATSLLQIFSPIYLTRTTFTNGSFYFYFTNKPNSSFSVLGSAAPNAPAQDWRLLGQTVESAPGEFEFTAPSGTDAQLFYRVTAP